MTKVKLEQKQREGIAEARSGRRSTVRELSLPGLTSDSRAVRVRVAQCHSVDTTGHLPKVLSPYAHNFNELSA